jgi:elongation factor Ts
MSTVSASLVKVLRERTGAGMLDCQKALIENNGDIEAAVDFLRKKGLAAAAKKAGRVAAEGLVVISVEGLKGAVVEINSETDFVARNDKFKELAKNISTVALKSSTIDSLKSAKYPSGKTVEEEITENIAIIGENLSLRRVSTLEVSNGVIASYMHNAVAPNMGKIGVIVALESAGNKDKLNELGKQIAMHAAAARPQALTVEDLDPATVEREKDIIREQSKASGRPADVIEKMIEGRIRKFYEEVVLLNQLFVIDGKTKISDVIANAKAEVGAEVKLTGFIRFELGEGIEVQASDFASEVASMSQR